MAPSTIAMMPCVLIPAVSMAPNAQASSSTAPIAPEEARLYVRIHFIVGMPCESPWIWGGDGGDQLSRLSGSTRDSSLLGSGASNAQGGRAFMGRSIGHDSRR